jgi:hypothetical protein
MMTNTKNSAEIIAMKHTKIMKLNCKQLNILEMPKFGPQHEQSLFMMCERKQKFDGYIVMCCDIDTAVVCNENFCVTFCHVIMDGFHTASSISLSLLW